MQFAGGRILVEIEDGVAFLTFNNPDKRNAMTLAMWDGMEAALERLAADAAVRVLVLTGAGNKAFVAGADIEEFATARADSAAQRAYDARTSAGRAKLRGFPHPVIARIRGACLGGGLGLAMQADLRIAAEDSSYGMPAARLGAATGVELARQLAAAVGPAHARMLMFTAGQIDAREAARIGLVNRVVPDADLSEVVLDIAGSIADNAPLAVAAAKRALALTDDPGGTDAAEVEAAIAACFDSADYREGRAAFLEKRSPRFRGA